MPLQTEQRLMSGRIDGLSSGIMLYAPEPAGLDTQLQQSHLTAGLRCFAC